MPKGFKRDDSGLCRQVILAEYSCMDFVTMDLHVLWSFDPEANLSAFGTKHDDPNIGSYGHAFSMSAREDQHSAFPGEVYVP